MKIIKEYRTYDKSSWGDGPWQQEPDKLQMIDEESGYDCLIVRANPHIGALCGYVGVPEGHPAYGKKGEYDDPVTRDVSVHGGITFAGRCMIAMPNVAKDLETQGVCHSGEVANHNVWWFGFDCAHSGDLAPALGASMGTPGGYYRERDTYKDVAYVTGEIKELARQLKALENV